MRPPHGLPPWQQQGVSATRRSPPAAWRPPPGCSARTDAWDLNEQVWEGWDEGSGRRVFHVNSAVNDQYLESQIFEGLELPLHLNLLLVQLCQLSSQ